MRDVLLEIGKEYNIEQDDVRSAPMGTSGIDVPMSPKGMALFRLYIECKNQQSLNVTTKFWKHFSKYKSKKNYVKMLVSKRNHTDPLVTMRLSDFMEYYKVWLRSQNS